MGLYNIVQLEIKEWPVIDFCSFCFETNHFVSLLLCILQFK
jgi:hypothetical protein